MAKKQPPMTKRQPEEADRPFTLAITSRALFDFSREDRLFQERGETDYRAHQRKLVEVPADPGVAFQFARKALALNERIPGSTQVVLLSRNDALTGIRSIRSAKHHGLALDSGCFACGESPLPYLDLFGADIFLSADPGDVAMALAAGRAAGLVWPYPQGAQSHPEQIRVAFDADCVLFNSESEDYFQSLGGNDGALDAFHERENAMVDEPMGSGPLKPFLMALNRLQSRFPGMVKTGVFTARDVGALDRCLRTFHAWGVDVDAAFPLAGRRKAEFLALWKPDLFFDDRASHCEHAAKVVPTAQVPVPVPAPSLAD
jgi:5'-nucleotidase